MGNFIAVVLIVLVLGLAISKLVKEKKSGAKCIGCPHGRNCSSNANSKLTLKKSDIKKKC